MRKPRLHLKELLDFTSLYKMLQIVWQSSKSLTLWRFGLQLMLSILPLVPIYLLKLLLDAFAVRGQYDFDYVVWILVGFASVKILSIIIGNVANYIAMLQSDVVLDYMSKIVIGKAIKTDLAYFDIDAYHDIYQRALGQEGRPLQVLNLTTKLMLSGFSLLAIVGLLISLHWAVAFILFFIALPSAAIRWYYSGKSVRLQEKQTPMARRAGYFRNILTNANYAKEVRVFDYGQHLLDTFLKLRVIIRKERRQLFVHQARMLSVAQSLESIAIVGALGLIAKRAYLGLLSVGDIAMYYQLFQKGQSNINSLLGTLVAIQENKLYIQHLFDFLNLEQQIKSPASPVPMPQKINQLSLKSIYFTYPNTTKEILTDISVTLKKGEIIAIVGENGSGKTTLVKLINRLYKQNKGEILFNNIPSEKFDLVALRQKITVIFQQFAKYYTTVKENILLADINSPTDDVRTKLAIDYAKATDFIHRLPNQLDTQLGRSFKNGEELSGGQWQKMALSRAFYKNADIIILDEPTSFIDPIAESDIFDNLRVIAEDKILILITHRIYNLKMSDRILVMDKGKLVESGNHEDLIQQGGLYATMFEKQQ